MVLTGGARKRSKQQEDPESQQSGVRAAFGVSKRCARQNRAGVAYLVDHRDETQLVKAACLSNRVGALEIDRSLSIAPAGIGRSSSAEDSGRADRCRRGTRHGPNRGLLWNISKRGC